MRFVLIADLHFGRADPDLARTLQGAIADLRPETVLVAGDMVQRARNDQFAQARAFLDGLPARWYAVPGNHDLPLFNLPARLFAPRAAYRRWIAEDVEFRLETGCATILGLDTTCRWQHQRGRIDGGQIARVAGHIEDAGTTLPLILAHHPFHQREEIAKNLMLNAGAALDAWGAAGPHVVMTGHLHEFLVEPFVARKGGTGQTLQIHCGTSTSTRRRGAPNDFAEIEVADRQVTVQRHVHDGETGAFEKAERLAYRATDQGWEAV